MMEPFGATATNRRPKETKTWLCSSAGLFSVTLKMFLLTASHLETKHVEAVQAGDVVVMLGSSAILPCHIITNDRLSQITWQKTIKGKAPNDVFLTIQPTTGVKYSNGQDLRFEFIGNVNDKNGTLKFSNVTLKDEGSYTCIFSLFPSGTQSRISQLVILVPPITNLMDHTPLEGNEEVPLATCTAAASKPKAEVRWIKGSLEGKVREELNETQHANGTTTTWSTLLGKPGREMNGQLVKCVISSEATKEEILETNIQVHYLPAKVNIIERSQVSFECETEANPNATVIWSRSGQPLPPSVKVVGTTLQFSSQSNDLSGLYQCETRNPYGSKQAYLFVHFSSGKCTGPIIIAVFSTLLILLILAIIGVYCHRTGKLQRFYDLCGEMRQVWRREHPEADVEERPEAKPLRTRSSSGQQEEEVFPGELPLLHSLPHHLLTLFCLCHGLSAPSCLFFPAYLLDHPSVPLSWVGLSPGRCASRQP
ncbi:poliovirus receptor homolog isoform X1 [Oryzias latipes]|uniref:poliovirus receptor homolog isoform X1 n=1 Tax=Oryzias latipes TaxID=8090 RepID=UPI0005CC273E|nr:poliovirus receptor homolog isoform X1 [Oryzias latipes]